MNQRWVKAFALGFVTGLGVFVITALILGRAKACRLPGGAIASAFAYSPIQAALPGALLGHLVGVMFCCWIWGTKP